MDASVGPGVGEMLTTWHSILGRLRSTVGTDTGVLAGGCPPLLAVGLQADRTIDKTRTSKNQDFGIISLITDKIDQSTFKTGPSDSRRATACRICS